jgi:hypothetical protein
MTSVYIILGAAGSGRREVLAGLVAEGVDGGARGVRVYHARGEVFPLGEAALPPGVEARVWGVDGERVFLDEPESAPEVVFVLGDGRANPVDQMEVLGALLPRLGWQVARVLTVVHCALLAGRPELGVWFKACLHFSDVALLARREGVSEAWMRAFARAHREACNPCALELVRRGRVENAARVLFPEARRLSMIFDDLDAVDEMEFDEENLPDEPFDLKRAVDPYFERTASGVRRLQLPDINAFLRD